MAGSPGGLGGVGGGGPSVRAQSMASLAAQQSIQSNAPPIHKFPTLIPEHSRAAQARICRFTFSHFFIKVIVM